MHGATIKTIWQHWSKMTIEVGLQNKVSNLVIPLKHNGVLCMKIRPNSVSDKATPGQETSIRVMQQHTNTRYHTQRMITLNLEEMSVWPYYTLQNASGQKIIQEWRQGNAISASTGRASRQNRGKRWWLLFVRFCKGSLCKCFLSSVRTSV
jgi:hypothetical protein